MINTNTSTIQTFRALSGSQYVFFTSEEPEPTGITNKVVMFETLSDQSVTASAQQSVESDILWSWNGADVSQFEPSVTRLAGGFGSADLNVETTTSAALGAYLVLSGTGTGQGTAIWFANDFLPSTSFIIEAGIETISRYDAGGVGGQYAGVALLGSGSGTDCHCLCILRTGAGTGWQARFDGSTTSIPGNTPSFGNPTPSKLVIECIAGKQEDSIPTFSIKGYSNGNNGNDTFTWDFNTNWSSTWGGQWTDIPASALNRWGLVVQASGGWQNPFIRFSYVVIRRHPLDKTEQP